MTNAFDKLKTLQNMFWMLQKSSLYNINIHKRIISSKLMHKNRLSNVVSFIAILKYTLKTENIWKYQRNLIDQTYKIKGITNEDSEIIIIN